MSAAERPGAGLICPSCLRRVGRAEIVHRCVAGPDPCSGGRRSVAADPHAPWAVCDGCGRTTARRHCRPCGGRLPEGRLGEPGRIVAVAGPPGSGKSTFLAVLLHELRHGLGAELGAALLPGDDRTEAEVRQRYEQPLYEQGRVLAAHAPGEGFRPLVHRLGLRYGRRERALTLVLLDTPAGADARPALAAADAAVLLLDPHDLPGTGLRRPGRGTRSAEVLDRALDALPRDAGGRIGVPVALGLAKLDLPAPGLPPYSPLHRRRRPRPGFDPVDRAAVDTEVRALLELWQGDGPVRRLREEGAAGHQLFAFSALGAPPRSGATPPGGPRPHRVEDPLLWLLHRFGLLPRLKRAGRA
ncbi:ATP-binding protein [Kitasatospora sp. NPDC015120]|uniref:ATP-binding protein n=1 Tax=Kitasatospora sp. NPDC015120 TaxID=3364023 RepID=UPI0036F47392